MIPGRIALKALGTDGVTELLRDIVKEQFDNLTYVKAIEDLLEVEISGESKKILVGADDKDEIEIKIKKEICAPIKKGTVIGEIVYRVNGERIISYEVVAGKTVKERTLWICAEYLRRKFLL